ncbi:MAG: hypothetical protein Q4G25_07200 [Paracoccus sp. (in: a-proteobacteria)]|nr:hypothetical protein [Paracoccus sp. (in: a-proteobacteria)]
MKPAPQPAAAPKPAAAPPAAPGPAKVAPPPPREYHFAEVQGSRLRLRHYLLIASFVLLVVVPTGLTAYLSWVFSGSMRQVTASVTVQEHSLGGFGDGSRSTALRAAFRGAGGDETAIVRQLVHSEDFFRTIRATVDLTEVWPADHVVPYLPMRFDPGATVEKQHEFWRNMVVVHLGSRDQIIRIRVTAFDQITAEMLLQAIRVEAERRLNLARTATLQAALTEATRRMEELRVENEADRELLKQFRLESRAVDPAVLAGLNAAQLNFLRQMRADEEIRIAEAEASVVRQQELTRRAETRMTAISALIDQPDASGARIASNDEITQLIARYQPLLTNASLSAISLRMAELSIVHYNQELESTKVFLSSVTGGSMSAIRVFPEFLPNLMIVSVGSFVMWVMVLLIFYGIRDRK